MSDEELESRIWVAIESGDVEKVREILSRRPDFITHKTDSGNWLHVATHETSLDMINLLVSLGCDVDAQVDDTITDTPLQYSITRDNPEFVEVLLNAGADPNNGRHVIMAVTGNKKNSLKIMKLLVEHGADIHRVFKHETANAMINALFMADAFGKEDVVEYLRSLGAVQPGEEPKANAPKKKAALKKQRDS